MHTSTVACLCALPVFACATFLIWISCYHEPALAKLNANTPIVRHLLHQSLFRGTADAAPSIANVFADPRNPGTRFKLRQLLPGDLIFGHNTGSAYGYWSHCSIYLGAGKCSQQSLSAGMSTDLVQYFPYEYHEIRVYRANLSAQQRQRICTFAQGKNAAIFDIAARKSDPRLWTCAKLCWAAYREVGINLCPRNQYVLPDLLIPHPSLYEVTALRIDTPSAKDKTDLVH